MRASPPVRRQVPPGMLRIGYVKLRDAHSMAHTQALKAMGCHVVRAGEAAGPGKDDSAVLSSILDFVGEGDELVVIRLEHLAHCSRSALDVIDRLESKGATLFADWKDLREKTAKGIPLTEADITAIRWANDVLNRK